jgi:hypothetical protein
MGIARDYAKCKVCGCKFVLRIGVGVEETCTHTFDCSNCHTPISVDLRTGKPGQAWIESRENVEIIPMDEGIDLFVNLHPAFAFKHEDFRSKFAFASMQHIELTKGKMRVSNRRIHDFALHFEVPNTPQIWTIVRSVLLLSLKSDPGNILQKQIKSYEAARKRYLPEFLCTTSFKCVASFFDDIFYPAIGELRFPLKAFVRAEMQSHPIEVMRFKDYYRSNLQAHSLERYLSTLGDYFRLFDQFRQVLTQVRVGSDDVDDLVVGSKRFDEIKLYYGQAYETLTSSYTTLACLNNIAAGRPFDQFMSMTLARYINDVEKAKKSNPFASVQTLSAFAQFENSALRNGSHHASIWREGDLIKYRSGGTGAEKDIAFSRYIHLCNGITISIAALLLVELEMFSDIAL